MLNDQIVSEHDGPKEAGAAAGALSGQEKHGKIYTIATIRRVTTINRLFNTLAPRAPR